MEQDTQRWSIALEMVEKRSSSGHYFAPEILRAFLCKLIDSDAVKLYGLSVASLDVQKIDNTASKYTDCGRPVGSPYEGQD